MTPIEKIAASTEIMANSINIPDPFWNTQWFSALIGAVTALLITYLKEMMMERNRFLSGFYKYLNEHGHEISPESIINKVRITLYGHTSKKDGTNTQIPEKKLSEKIIIGFRRRCKYWHLPKSIIKHKLRKYEFLLKKIPDRGYKKSAEYENAEKHFQKILDYAYKKTGENMWTAR